MCIFWHPECIFSVVKSNYQLITPKKYAQPLTIQPFADFLIFLFCDHFTHCSMVWSVIHISKLANGVLVSPQLLVSRILPSLLDPVVINLEHVLALVSQIIIRYE